MYLYMVPLRKTIIKTPAIITPPVSLLSSLFGQKSCLGKTHPDTEQLLNIQALNLVAPEVLCNLYELAERNGSDSDLNMPI